MTFFLKYEKEDSGRTGRWMDVWDLVTLLSFPSQHMLAKSKTEMVVLQIATGVIVYGFRNNKKVFFPYEQFSAKINS